MIGSYSVTIKIDKPKLLLILAVLSLMAVESGEESSPSTTNKFTKVKQADGTLLLVCANITDQLCRVDSIVMRLPLSHGFWSAAFLRTAKKKQRVLLPRLSNKYLVEEYQNQFYYQTMCYFSRKACIPEIRISARSKNEFYHIRGRPKLMPLHTTEDNWKHFKYTFNGVQCSEARKRGVNQPSAIT